MDAKAGSKKRKSSRFFTPGLRIFVNVANALFYMLMLAILYVGSIVYLKHAYCVILPNNYMIGYPSIFGPTDDGLVDMLLRDTSGRTVLRTDAWIDFDRGPENPSMVRLNHPGGAMEMDGTKIMPLIWDGHPIGGPKRNWNEPKPDHPRSVDIISTDFWTVYLKLRKSGDFDKVDCGTP